MSTNRQKKAPTVNTAGMSATKRTTPKPKGAPETAPQVARNVKQTATARTAAHEFVPFNADDYATVALPGDTADVLADDYTSENRIDVVYRTLQLVETDKASQARVFEITKLLSKELRQYRRSLVAADRTRKWEAFLAIYGIPAPLANKLARVAS